MESAADTVPAKRKRTEGHHKTQIPPETMLEVLRWLDRFDLDGKQITSRWLRSLVESKQMPLRKVDEVGYSCRYGPLKEPRLQIFLNLGDHGRPTAELTCETDADVQKAASYLSSCFVRLFNVYGHLSTLSRNVVIAAPPLIHRLYIGISNFAKGEEDTLSATLNGTWQIDDKRLESLRRRGCNEIEVSGSGSKYDVTEEGILSYCFTLDDDLPVPERRYLRTDAESATITPAFFKKVVEASKNSKLTRDVELRLLNLRLDVRNLDVGVLPSRCREVHEHHVRYNIAECGNGIRLLIHFQSMAGEEWRAVVRHGKKDHKEFFDTPEDSENGSDLENGDLVDYDLD